MSTSPKGRQVLLTGSTGFVGKVVLEELLRRREELGIEKINLLIRPRGRKSPEDRFNRSAMSRAFSLLEPGWKKYCEPVAGDMLDEGLGLSDSEASRLHDELTHIIH